MTAIDLRTEIMQLLHEESNTSILEAIRVLLRRGEAEGDEDFTEEDMAELEKRRADRLSGASKPHGMEESMRKAREGFKK